VNLRQLRGLAALAAVCLLLSCSGGDRRADEAPPTRQDDICAIFDQRPNWREPIFASARKWGAPVPVQMAIIWRESSFRSNVRPPAKYVMGVPTGHISSAYGFSQAIDGTWDWYRQETGNGRADRTRWEDATDFVGWYMAKSFASNGIGMHDAFNQYLAYHEGHTGHLRGSYRAKPWLTEVAAQVAAQAARYRGQLRLCP
jgi:hypothetical protein